METRWGQSLPWRPRIRGSTRPRSSLSGSPKLLENVRKWSRSDSSHVDHEEAPATSHIPPRHGRHAGAASARFHDPRADADAQDGGGSITAPGIRLRAPWGDHG